MRFRRGLCGPDVLRGGGSGVQHRGRDSGVGQGFPCGHSSITLGRCDTDQLPEKSTRVPWKEAAGMLRRERRSRVLLRTTVIVEVMGPGREFGDGSPGGSSRRKSSANSRSSSFAPLAGVGAVRLVGSGGEGGSREVVPFAPRFARASATSFPGIPACPGTHVQRQVTVVMRRRSARAARANATCFRFARGFFLDWVTVRAYWLSTKRTTGGARGPRASG